MSRFRDKVEHNRALWILRYVRACGPVDMHRGTLAALSREVPLGWLRSRHDKLKLKWAIASQVAYLAAIAAMLYYLVLP